MNPLINLIKYLKPRHYHLNPPATDEAIRECESALKLRLPRDYTEFLKFANGAELPLSHELFGTIEIDAGIGNMTDSRSFPIGKGLPREFLLFHDDGQDTHAFEIEPASQYDIRKIIQWNAASLEIVKEYTGLKNWLEYYIQPAIKYHDEQL